MSEETRTKKTIVKAPLAYALCSITRDDAGNIVRLDVLPTPGGVKEHNRRDQYRRAVRAVLESAEDGDMVAAYNGKQLTVVSFPEPFIFNAVVKEETIRSVQITEG